MLGKKILAGIFAALILIKLPFLLISPEKWLGVGQTFFGYTAIAMVIYLMLLVITGYFIFTTLDLIDVAVVMLFTSTLVGITLIPYSGSLVTLSREFATVGLDKAWLGLVIWVAIAVAVLYRVFSGRRKNRVMQG
jgi:hypothetical protein